MSAAPQPLDLPEILFRAGLVLGAWIFFAEAMGHPWTQGFFGVAALLLSFVIVITLLFQWRVLGDWRQPVRIAFAAALIPVIATPIAAVFYPTLGSSLLPDSVETAIRESLGMLAKMPGFAALGTLISGLISFLLLLLCILVLAIAGRNGSRAGIGAIGVALLLATLFFYPSAETVAGFLFLGYFLYIHWETPLILPEKILQSLNATQGDYLRQLQQAGGLSTGETRLYLENSPALFEQLVDLQLVQYDAIAREVVPGPKLSHDPAARALESCFSVARRGGWILLGVGYFLMPDLIPGPIDDFIILAITSGIGSDLLGRLFGGGRTRR
ncbi:hypothetical protein GC173_18925 [bacterium]|nr:hypothetical protein [bacterium]